VRAAGLSALARGVDDPGAIPVAEIENLAIAGAGNLLPGIAHAGSVGRVFVARTSERAQVEQILAARLLVEGVPKMDDMKFAPGPLRSVGAEELR
jgi:hypothetical protein